LTTDISTKTINYPNGTFDINVSSNINWSVTDNASWITLSSATGTGNGIITVTYTENASCSLRNGTITLTGSGVADVVVSVIQNGISTVTDIDNNTYNVVCIGTQLWLKENLKVTKNPSGTNITTYNPNNDPSNVASYGKLYDWNTAMNGNTNEGSQGICPSGWHIPTVNEWNTLNDYLGSSSISGSKLKEIGTTHWFTNVGATNESGFSAVGSGYRNCSNIYSMFMQTNYLWSSTQTDINTAKSFVIVGSSSGTGVNPNDGKCCGFPIRCIKN